MAKSKLQWPSDDQKSISYIVHSFRVHDAEDPDLYAAHPMLEWEKSEVGQWVMNNSTPTPSWHREVDSMTFGYKYHIRAYLTPKQLTYFKLKYE